MSGKIFLIVEDKTDYEIVKAILSLKNIPIQVKPIIPPGKTGSITRLAGKIDQLITDTKPLLTGNDCIAVLYDTDIHKDPSQIHQKKIIEACKRHKVEPISAQDEIESWLLADGGICKWLKQKQKNWDEEPKPKNSLNTVLKDNRKSDLEHGGLQAVIQNLAGDGDKHSPSMKKALKTLEGAPCYVKPSDKKS